jgi:hypothetical protein
MINAQAIIKLSHGACFGLSLGAPTMWKGLRVWRKLKTKLKTVLGWGHIIAGVRQRLPGGGDPSWVLMEE